ncbi:MAG: SHOCT-like domain-containing protein [Eubacteriales bacterium]
MSNEKLRILEMVEKGQITADDALDLMNAVDNHEEKRKNTSVHSNLSNRFLRVRVNGSTNIKKVDVNVPLSLIKIATGFMNLIPKEAQNQMKEKGIDLSSIDFNALITMIDEGLADSKLVDIEIDDEKEGEMQVEVYVD